MKANEDLYFAVILTYGTFSYVETPNKLEYWGKVYCNHSSDVFYISKKDFKKSKHK